MLGGGAAGRVGDGRLVGMFVAGLDAGSSAVAGGATKGLGIGGGGRGVSGLLADGGRGLGVVGWGSNSAASERTGWFSGCSGENSSTSNGGWADCTIGALLTHRADSNSTRPR